MTRFARFVEWTQACAARSLAVADAAMNRLYGWRGNPLYQSGTLVVLAFLLMLATGLYLLLFYRVDDPYASMQRIEAQVWAGRWMRALHRYAADATLVFAAVHALRMYAQRRTWGARALPWISGLVLLFIMLVCGWTGYVMIWDEHALLLAVEGARLMDALPIFSEPLVRTFVGEREIPGAFFFLNLFAHVALPIGVLLVLWIHVSKLARPVLLPPRALSWSFVVLLFAASVIAPAPLGPEADPFVQPTAVTIDWFYSFWLAWSRPWSPAAVWSAFLFVSAALLLVPIWSRPPKAARPAPSRTNPHLCTGCFQCALDCPYGAIEMIEIPERDHPVARVDPGDCVSCGICTASCAPMVVGPAGRTGRDQLEEIRSILRANEETRGDVVVIACRNGAGRIADAGRLDGALVHPVSCVGHVHTSVIELLIRGGARGVLIASCPPRDCQGREGPRLLQERVYEGREAELRESLDRRRLRVEHAGPAERGIVVRALEDFRRSLDDVAPETPEVDAEIDAECEPKDPKEMAELL